jgi:hypothetical protein
MELTITEIRQKIHLVRGLQVVLDRELAEFYQTKTKVLNQAVRRNSDRFPADFMIQLSIEEYAKIPTHVGLDGSLEGHGGRRYLPYGFTQEGISMLSGVLGSQRAVQINILIMRAFVQLRQASEAHLDLVKRFDQLESRCNEQYSAVLDAVLRPMVTLAYQPTTFLASYYESSMQGMVECNVSEVSETAISASQVAESKLEVEHVIVKKEHQSKINIIQQAVVKYFGLRISDLKIATRSRSIVLPRQIAIYLIRKHTGIGFKEIGRAFGGKDHTTILAACRKIADALGRDGIIQDAVQAIEAGFPR